MARLIAGLIRHGDYHQQVDTPSAHQPWPLTDKGRQQAVLAAGKIREMLQSSGCQLDTVIECSSLLRAWQTADILRQELSAKAYRLASSDQLAERSVGSLANLTLAQIESVMAADTRYPPLPDNWKSDSHFRLPHEGAESLMDAGQRVAAYLQGCMAQLHGRAQGNTLKLFVGHGAAMRHAAYHLGVLPYARLAELSMYHAEPVYLEWQPQEQRWLHVAGSWKTRATGKPVFPD